MDKSKLNFLIDSLMFLIMAALAGLGFLIKYVLIPGREAWAKWGRQMEITWLGLDRHDWVEVLPYLAFLLLGLFILRIILHGKMVIDLLTRFISQPVSRLGVALVFLVVAIILLTLPLLVPSEVNEVGVRGDLGLEAPSSGIEGFRLSAADLRTQDRESTTDIAGQAAVEVEWTKESPQVKVASKKGHTDYRRKLSKYQTISPLNSPEDNFFARSQKRTSNLVAYCQLPRRRSP
jgi:hypothetical protein